MSPLASLLFKGLATKHASVKWTVVVSAKLKCSFIFPAIFFLSRLKYLALLN